MRLVSGVESTVQYESRRYLDASRAGCKRDEVTFFKGPRKDGGEGVENDKYYVMFVTYMCYMIMIATQLTHIMHISIAMLSLTSMQPLRSYSELAPVTDDGSQGYKMNTAARPTPRRHTDVSERNNRWS